jgi:hypothetical protein
MHEQGSAERDVGGLEVEIVHPNRSKPAVQATRSIVILLLLASVALLVIITIGGWKALEGAKPEQIAYILIYVILAWYAGRWNRGVLPLSAALAIILMIFAAIAAPGWFDRNKPGFTQPALHANVLGLLTILLIPLQLLLIVFAMRGFQQGWNVEEERPLHGGHGHYDVATAS